MRQERDFISAVIDTQATLVVVLDPEGRIVRWNRACEELTGYSFEEVRKKSLWDLLLTDEERPQARAVFDQIIKGTGGRTHTNFWITKTRRKRLIDWTNGSIRSDRGEVQFVIGTGVDVTDRRELQSQLLQSQKMEAIGRLAGGVAHDFNNLLSVIQNYAAFVSEDLDDNHPSQSDIQEIIRAVASATALVQRLLMFARKEMVKPEVLDLNQVVVGIKTLLRRTIGEDIGLSTRLAKKIYPVRADRSQVEQVVTNLALNARDAMPNGGDLMISTVNVDFDGKSLKDLTGEPPGKYVCVTVRDTGRGMSSEDMSRIFEPFFTTKPKGMGTGLGLSVVHSVVTQAEGRICVESLPGVGSTFRVYLPATDEADSEGPTGDLGDVSRAGGQKIAVVEDEEALGRLVERMLVKGGYEVVRYSPHDLIEQLSDESFRIDVLLTDVVMPEMSGKVLANEVLRRCPQCAVLYMSGYAGDVLESRGISADEIDLLNKPFGYEELMIAIKNAILGRAIR
ncbi:MAG: ATP-binding protein [Actinomycetota bacterium]|nr:ATP-binding protein [Actinomycetota bacterium]